MIRAVALIFQSLEPDTTMVFSCYQVLNEKVYDCFCHDDHELFVKTDDVGGATIENIGEYLVLNVIEAVNLIQISRKNFKSRCIRFNVARSHYIFELKVERIENERLKCSKLKFYDLIENQRLTRSEQQ